MSFAAPRLEVKSNPIDSMFGNKSLPVIGTAAAASATVAASAPKGAAPSTKSAAPVVNWARVDYGSVFGAVKEEEERALIAQFHAQQAALSAQQRLQYEALAEHFGRAVHGAQANANALAALQAQSMAATVQMQHAHHAAHVALAQQWQPQITTAHLQLPAHFAGPHQMQHFYSYTPPPAVHVVDHSSPASDPAYAAAFAAAPLAVPTPAPDPFASFASAAAVAAAAPKAPAMAAPAPSAFDDFGGFSSAPAQPAASSDFGGFASAAASAPSAPAPAPAATGLADFGGFSSTPAPAPATGLADFGGFSSAPKPAAAVAPAVADFGLSAAPAVSKPAVSDFGGFSSAPAAPVAAPAPVAAADFGGFSEEAPKKVPPTPLPRPTQADSIPSVRSLVAAEDFKRALLALQAESIAAAIAQLQRDLDDVHAQLQKPGAPIVTVASLQQRVHSILGDAGAQRVTSYWAPMTTVAEWNESLLQRAIECKESLVAMVTKLESDSGGQQQQQQQQQQQLNAEAERARAAEAERVRAAEAERARAAAAAEAERARAEAERLRAHEEEQARARAAAAARAHEEEQARAREAEAQRAREEQERARAQQAAALKSSGPNYNISLSFGDSQPAGDSDFGSFAAAPPPAAAAGDFGGFSAVAAQPSAASGFGGEFGGFASAAPAAAPSLAPVAAHATSFGGFAAAPPASSAAAASSFGDFGDFAAAPASSAGAVGGFDSFGGFAAAAPEKLKPVNRALLKAWMAVTKSCAAEIDKARTMLANIEEKRASNPEQTAAFLVSPKAREYFGGVLEVERVVQRIAGSLAVRGAEPGLDEETRLMSSAVKFIDKEWRALAASLAHVGTLQFSADADNAKIQSALGGGTNASRTCHLCYVPIVAPTEAVEWEGASYCTGCKSFWINRIQPTPPPKIGSD